MIGQLMSWWKGNQPEPIPDPLWRTVIDRLPFLRGLSQDEWMRLRTLCSKFLANKEFNGSGGLQLDDEICLSIAVQGCLPIMNLGLDWYRGWHGIVVYPDEFLIPRDIIDDDGVVHHFDEIAAGEAWSGGPLIISWSDAQMTQGEYNVVIHEFAHKIDMLNGNADGCPPLQKNQSNATWQRVWRSAYQDFCQRLDSAPIIVMEDENGEEFDEPEFDSALDPYAAEAPGEFFAVASEVFFTCPRALKTEYPEVYEQLSILYQQDPSSRL